MNRLIYSGNVENIELDVDVVDGRMVAILSSRQKILYPISKERKSIPQLIYFYSNKNPSLNGNTSAFIGKPPSSMYIEDLITTLISDVSFLVASGIPAVEINLTLNLSRHIADEIITNIFRDACEGFCHRSTSGMFHIDVSHSTTSEENVLKRNIRLTVTRNVISFIWYENGECYATDVAKKLIACVKNCYIRANLLAKYRNGTIEIVDSIDLWGNYDIGYISATNADGYDILITPYEVYFYGKRGYTHNYHSFEFAKLTHRELYKALSNELSEDEQIMKYANKETYFDSITKEFTFDDGGVKIYI